MEKVGKAAVVLVTLSMFTGVVAARDEVIKITISLWLRYKKRV